MNLLEQDTNPVPDYRTIPLTQGKVAVVSAHRYDYLMQWKWHALSSDGVTFYAARQITVGRKKQRHIWMHRQILGITDPKIKCDHWDGDGLHNWDDNLRLATHAQNMQNMRRKRSNASGFIGVRFKKERGKWVSNIGYDAKQIHLGYFDDSETAARARDFAAIALYGDFAKLNFPQELERRKAEAAEERPTVN